MGIDRNSGSFSCALPTTPASRSASTPAATLGGHLGDRADHPRPRHLRLAHLTHHTLLARIALAALLTGALANLADRASDGVVTDYLHTGWWPTFNLADTLIVIGGVLLPSANSEHHRPQWKDGDHHAHTATVLLLRRSGLPAGGLRPRVLRNRDTAWPHARTAGRGQPDRPDTRLIVCTGFLPSHLTTTAQVVPEANARTVRSTCSGDQNGLGGRTCRTVPSLVTAKLTGR